MKKAKKPVLLLIAAVLAAVMLTACNRDNGGGAATGTGTGAPVAVATPAPATPAPPPPPPEERATVSFSIRVESGLVMAGMDDEIFHYIQDTLNIQINPIVIEDNTVMAVMAAAGDLPDVFQMNTFMHENFYNWVDQGVLRDIPRGIIANFPEVERRVQASMEVDVVSQVRNGLVWFLPKPFDLNPLLLSSPNRLWYRADWVRDLGMDTPTTIDELWDMMQAFQDNNLGIFPMTAPGNWTMMAMIPMFSGLDMDGWSEVDGRWIPNFANPRQMEGLQWLRDAFQAGFIDPEFTITGVNPSLEGLAAGIYGFVPRNGGDPFWIMRTSRFLSDIMGDDYTEIDAWQSGVLGIMPPLIAPGNTRSYWPPRIDSDGFVFSSRVSDATMEVILEFFDWGMHPDRQRLARHGLEGITHTMDGTNVVRTIDPETNAPFHVPTMWPGTQLLNLMTWDFNAQWDFNEPDTWVGHNYFRTESLRINEPYNAALIEEGEGTILRIARLPRFVDFRMFVNPLSDYSLILMGDRPVEDMWNEMINQWNALGLQQAIDEATAFMAAR